MRIYFERSGGFAGIRYRTTVDTADLPPQEASPLEEMIYEVNFFDLPERINNSEQARDMFYYRLTVSDGERSKTVEMSGSAVPDDLQPLLHELSQIARTRRH